MYEFDKFHLDFKNLIAFPETIWESAHQQFVWSVLNCEFFWEKDWYELLSYPKVV